MTRKYKYLGAVMLALGVVVIWLTGRLPESNLSGDPGPRLYPYFMASILMLSSVLLILQKGPEEKPFLTREQWPRLVLLFVLFIVFAVLIRLVGFYPVAPVMLFLLCSLFSKGKQLPLWRKLVYTAGMWLFIFLLFRVVLKLPLPRGTLF